MANDNENEIRFGPWYLHHTVLPPNPNQTTVVSTDGPLGFGNMAVNDWAIYDSHKEGVVGNVIARAQGLHVQSSMENKNWFTCFSILLLNQRRYFGSTLQVMGHSVEEDQWAIVGGTGDLTLARGIIYKTLKEQNLNGNIIELNIFGFYTVLPKPDGWSPKKPALVGTGKNQGANTKPPTKVGPWGGRGGTPRDIADAPDRLESITIRSGRIIDSLAFSYINQAGQKQVAGPWGGGGGRSTTIQLGPSEFVKEIKGTVGEYDCHNVVTSLTVVTNTRVYGPFGTEQRTRFAAPVENNGSVVVAFFGCSGIYLDSVGVYTV